MAKRKQSTALFRLHHGNATRDAVKAKSTTKSGRAPIQRYDWQRLERFLAAWDRGHDTYMARQRDLAEYRRWQALSEDERALELYDLTEAVKRSIADVERVFEENPECEPIEAFLRGLYDKQRELDTFDISAGASPYVV